MLEEAEKMDDDSVHGWCSYSFQRSKVVTNAMCMCITVLVILCCGSDVGSNVNLGTSDQWDTFEDACQIQV